jgi:hypothetical protein
MVTPTPPGGRVPTPEAAATEQEFNIDEALNTKGFPEFLAQFPDSASVVDDVEEIGRRFEAFENKAELAKNMRELFKQQIQEETGLKLNDKELAAIDDLIGKEAINNPDRIGEVAEMVDDYRGNAEDIAKMEVEIQKYGGDAGVAAKIVEMKGDYSKLRDIDMSRLVHYVDVIEATSEGLFSFFGSTKREASNALRERKALGQKYGIKSGWDGMFSHGEYNEKLEKLEREIKFIEDAVVAKATAAKEFKRLKSEVMEGFLPVAEVMKVAKTRAQDRLKAMLVDVGKDFTLKKADEAEDFLAKLQEASAAGNTNYLEGIDADKFTNDLNMVIETKVEEQLIDAVKKSPIASGSLSALEKALEKFSSQEKIGSREGDEVKVFIKETLDVILADTTTPVPKKILINRIIAKLNA